MSLSVETLPFPLPGFTSSSSSKSRSRLFFLAYSRTCVWLTEIRHGRASLPGRGTTARELLRIDRVSAWRSIEDIIESLCKVAIKHYSKLLPFPDIEIPGNEFSASNGIFPGSLRVALMVSTAWICPVDTVIRFDCTLMIIPSVITQVYT